MYLPKFIEQLKLETTTHLCQFLAKNGEQTPNQQLILTCWGGFSLLLEKVGLHDTPI